MTADITYARGNNNTPCKVALYDAPKGTPFSDIDKCPIANVATQIGDSASVLSLIVPTEQYTDIEGATVKMVTRIGDKQYEDVVTMVGVKNASYIVRIDGKDYAVRKSIVRFVVNRE